MINANLVQLFHIHVAYTFIVGNFLKKYYSEHISAIYVYVDSSETE